MQALLWITTDLHWMAVMCTSAEDEVLFMHEGAIVERRPVRACIVASLLSQCTAVRPPGLDSLLGSRYGRGPLLPERLPDFCWLNFPAETQRILIGRSQARLVVRSPVGGGEAAAELTRPRCGVAVQGGGGGWRDAVEALASEGERVRAPRRPATTSPSTHARPAPLPTQMHARSTTATSVARRVLSCHLPGLCRVVIIGVMRRHRRRHRVAPPQVRRRVPLHAA
eukprot:COSAG01_NODE_459_length_16728_cov_50.324794_9_plen_225_part_00